MKPIFKNETGITLIALIITIIILLILAGVTLSLVIGDNGLINNANTTKLNTEYAKVDEAINLEFADYTTKKNMEENYCRVFIEFLQQKEVVNEDNIINISKILGDKMSTGNGSGSSDVYKLEKVTEENEDADMQNIKYKLVYYDKNNNATEIGNIEENAKIVTIEDVLICENGTITGVNPNYLTEPVQGECVENKTINEKFEDIVIPESINGVTVTKIKEFALAGIRNLKSVYIPDTVTEIEGAAFVECISLETVAGMKNVSKIGQIVFNYCSSLKNIELPQNLIYLGEETFSNCTSLETIVIPDSITCITGRLFSNCTSLNNVVLPNALTKIYSGAFSNCTGIANIIIPKSVNYVSGGAFEGWTAEQTINCETTSEYANANWNSSWEQWNEDCNAVVVWEYKRTV